jgi:hypothetical protein
MDPREIGGPRGPRYLRSPSAALSTLRPKISPALKVLPPRWRRATSSRLQLPRRSSSGRRRGCVRGASFEGLAQGGSFDSSPQRSLNSKQSHRTTPLDGLTGRAEEEPGRSRVLIVSISLMPALNSSTWSGSQATPRSPPAQLPAGRLWSTCASPWSRSVLLQRRAGWSYGNRYSTSLNPAGWRFEPAQKRHLA